jgi:hypothetical protein
VDGSRFPGRPTGSSQLCLLLRTGRRASSSWRKKQDRWTRRISSKRWVRDKLWMHLYIHTSISLENRDWRSRLTETCTAGRHACVHPGPRDLKTWSKWGPKSIRDRHEMHILISRSASFLGMVTHACMSLFRNRSTEPKSLYGTVFHGIPNPVTSSVQAVRGTGDQPANSVQGHEPPSVCSVLSLICGCSHCKVSAVACLLRGSC